MARPKRCIGDQLSEMLMIALPHNVGIDYSCAHDDNASQRRFTGAEMVRPRSFTTTSSTVQSRRSGVPQRHCRASLLMKMPSAVTTGSSSRRRKSIVFSAAELVFHAQLGAASGSAICRVLLRRLSVVADFRQIVNTAGVSPAVWDPTESGASLAARCTMIQRRVRCSNEPFARRAILNARGHWLHVARGRSECVDLAAAGNLQ